MPRFWEFHNNQWKLLAHSPVPGLFDLEADTDWDKGVISFLVKNDYLYSHNVLNSLSANGVSRVFEKTENTHSLQYRYMVNVSEYTDNYEAVFLPDLPDYFQFLQLLKSIKEVIIPEDEADTMRHDE